MKSYTLITIALALSARLAAQTPPQADTTWTARQCMAYAVSHNHDVRRSQLRLSSLRATRVGASAAWLPRVEASVGAQYNFGRAIDPETNTYTDVATFYNSYGLSASLPLFDGFSRLHALRAARASELMGRSDLSVQQAETALAALQAFVDVAYYQGTLLMAEEKRQESSLLLHQTRVMEEVGRKSQADVAQMEAQLLGADYELARQQQLLASALLSLKQSMAFPLDEPLAIDDAGPQAPGAEGGGQGAEPMGHPLLLSSYYQMQASRHEWHQARAALFPSLSLGAGLSTTYYHTLHTPNATSLSSQLRNNMGQYVAATLSLPLFNRLQTVTSIRRAKNDYLMAREAYSDAAAKLQKLTAEALGDAEAYRLQTGQMEAKVKADSLAYQLTRRQYEEGLATAIELHEVSAQLLQSRATLLQCRLMLRVKQYLIKYYKGETIWTE